MKDEHEVIYLAPRCMESPYEGRTWCQDPDVEDCECVDGPHPWVKYVLADRALAKEQALTEQVERVALTGEEHFEFIDVLRYWADRLRRERREAPADIMGSAGDLLVSYAMMIRRTRTPPNDTVARIVAGLKERERESLNGHVITGIRLWIESGDWKS